MDYGVQQAQKSKYWNRQTRDRLALASLSSLQVDYVKLLLNAGFQLWCAYDLAQTKSRPQSVYWHGHIRSFDNNALGCKREISFWKIPRYGYWNHSR